MHDIVIVGSGPSGLCLASHLITLGNEVLVLEKGATVANTWNTMPDYLQLVSPPRSNSLLNEYFKDKSRLERITAKDYFNYLNDFSKKEKINIHLNSEVLEVTKDEKGLLLKTNDKIYKTKKLVWATGYFTNPVFPEVFKSCSGIKVLHTKEIASVAQLIQSNIKKVLIVGKRLSAGQIIDQLEIAKIEYEISTRSPIEFMKIGNLFFRFMDEIESLILKCTKNSRIEVDVKMESTIVAKRIKNNKLRLRPEVECMTKDEVIFSDKSRSKYDAIILATGYAPTIAPLKQFAEKINFSELESDFQHKDVSGLYFLGFSLQVNFRSRFIRGIRKDAALLAKILNKALL